MKLYFTDRQIPELAPLPKPLFRAARNRCLLPLWHEHLWYLFFLMMGLCVLGGICGKAVSSSGSADVIGMMIGGQIGYQIYIQWIYEMSRPVIREFLEEQQREERNWS